VSLRRHNSGIALWKAAPSHEHVLDVVTPLVGSGIDNVMVKTALELNQSLFQFINAVDVLMVNTHLNGRSDNQLG